MFEKLIIFVGTSILLFISIMIMSIGVVIFSNNWRLNNASYTVIEEDSCKIHIFVNKHATLRIISCEEK